MNACLIWSRLVKCHLLATNIECCVAYWFDETYRFLENPPLLSLLVVLLFTFPFDVGVSFYIWKIDRSNCKRSLKMLWKWMYLCEHVCSRHFSVSPFTLHKKCMDLVSPLYRLTWINVWKLWRAFKMIQLQWRNRFECKMRLNLYETNKKNGEQK